MSSTLISASRPPETRVKREPVLRSLLQIAICFAMLTGLVEGGGLLLFQRINWARWGKIEHVSLPIFWVAPTWDCVLFLCAALAIAAVARLVPRLPVIRVAVFIFAVIMFYDWLALPERLVHRSAVILAIGLATVLFRACRKREEWLVSFSRPAAVWSVAAVVLVWAAISFSGWASEKSATSHLAAAQPGAPNIVVIVVDTLRADHLSGYGYPRPTSPNIDRIAQQGVLFQNAFSASSWTLPSHASLLTGRFAYEHGATDVKPPAGRALDSRYPTLPEFLAAHGYRTGAFSANYVYFSKDLGLGRGFLHFEDYFHSAFDGFSRTLYGRESSRLVLSHDRVRRLLIRLGFPSVDELQPNSKTSWFVRKRASKVNSEALAWIDRNPNRPFFVFMNYFDTHRPYGTPPGYPRKFLHMSTHEAYVNEVTSSAPNAKTDLYDESVAYVDDQVGNFFTALKRRSLDQNTLIVITSDHGDLLGEHGLMGHRTTLYFPLIHIPLILWQPGRIPAGVRIQTPVSNVSLATTVADDLGMAGASEFPGPSWKQLWSAPQSQPAWPHPLSELARFRDEAVNIPSRYGAMKSLVTPQYHYMFHETFGTQLFDWIHDPEENSNLISTPESKPLAESLADEIQRRTAPPR